MSDAPETVESLCFHLRQMADNATYQIDADRLCRAANICSSGTLTDQKVTALVDVSKRLGRWCADNIPKDAGLDPILSELDAALGALKGGE